MGALDTGHPQPCPAAGPAPSQGPSAPPPALPYRCLVPRAAGVALLRRDMPGAFLLRPEPGLPKRWCLWVRAPCGVVSYSLARTHQGRFCVEVSAGLCEGGS